MNLCKFCDIELDPIVVVPHKVDDEIRGPDLAWGCPGCKTLFEVFLANDPHRDGDTIIVHHDSYLPEWVAYDD